MTPTDQMTLQGFVEAMGGLSKVGAALSLAQRISRMAARQYYGLTGELPRGASMASLGVGEHGAMEQLRAAQSTGKGVPTAQARLEAAREKLDTLPGFLRGITKNPGRTARLGWHSHGPTGKFIIGTAPIVPVYGAVTGKDLRPGETVRGRIGEEAGRTLGFSATGALPFLPSIGAGMAAGKAGKALVESLGSG